MPAQLRADITYQVKQNNICFIFIDKIQKIAQLTNEVHNLMSIYPKLIFILSGSSAQKLKRGNANLLGGRAILEYLLPLTYSELGKKFELSTVLQHGSIVGIYFDEKKIRAKNKITKADIKGLLELKKEYPSVELICVCEVETPYFIDTIHILPYALFLSKLNV